MIKLKKLTTKGEQALEDQLRLFNAGGITDLNLDIRTFKYEAIGQEISIDENKKFDTKYDLVCYLYQALKCLDTIPSAIWNFLAVVYFKQLYKKESKEVKRLFIGDDTSHYPFPIY